MPCIDDFNRLPDDVAMALRLASEALTDGLRGADARVELARIRDRYTVTDTVVVTSTGADADADHHPGHDDVVVLRGPAPAPVDHRAVVAVRALARPDLAYSGIVDELRELDASVLNLLSDETVARAASAPLRAALAQLRHSGRLRMNQHDAEVLLEVDGRVIHSWITLAAD